MKTYEVTFPIIGKACIEVEAANEAEAVSKAVERLTIDDVYEWREEEDQADVVEV